MKPEGGKQLRKVRGSVSLFTAMVFLLVASVITMTIRGARMQGAKVMVRTASSMALDSVFAEYNYQLFSKFGVLLFDGKQGGKEVSKDALAAKIGDYMQYNLDTDKGLYFSGNTDLYGIHTSGVSVERLIMATDYSGLLWEDMVVDYEKYAKPINLAAEYLGFEDTSKEAQAVQEISDQIVECTEQILNINKKVRVLVAVIDGVVCPENGIDYLNVEIKDNFIKKFCPMEISYDSLKINQIKLYSMISPKVQNPLESIARVKSCIKSGNRLTAANELTKISGLAMDCINCINDTDMLNDFIGVDMDSLKDGLNNVDLLINSNSEYLSDEVMEGLTEEIVQIEKYREVMADEVCDVDAIIRKIAVNKDILEEVVYRINQIDVYGDADTVQNQLTELEKTIKKYNFAGLEFNYSTLGKSCEDTSILDSLSNFLENGILAIVVPEGKAISSNIVPRLPDSASNVCGKTNDTSLLTAGGDAATLITKKIIYTEYVMDNFASFMDEKGGTVCNYEVEYVICGENSDKKNLTETVMRIAALRSGVNMVYLLTDSEKKNEAHTLAQAMAGAAAMEPVVKLIQYTLMYLWAFAEGLSDVRRLLSGEKIEITKSKDTWNLSFDKLLAYDFSSSSGNKGSQNGLDYEMFLRILLYMESDSLKAAYTMDLVEFYMIIKYNKEFRLNDYVYGMEISTGYGLTGLTGNYTEKSVYTY